MTKRLISVDPLSGMETWHEYDSATDTTIIRSVEDVEPVLDHNKALFNEGDAGWSPTREWRRAASIPASIILKWKVELGIDVFNPNHKDAVKRLLNSSEWLYLRTAPGHL
jgi:hypothetical protein